MKKLIAVIALALTAAACGTVQTSTPPRTAPPGIPSTPLELGNWQSASVGLTLTQFAENVARRYRPGLALSTVNADLRRQDFNCANNTDSVRGDPPDAICRKTETVNGCTHTWQVHLFDEDNNAILLRTRGLYDRRCGNDGLLGGPG
ncbi:hypothetical protein U91I_02185 [alpha proteobacterium U9-1i]|nr:hypothetical protein U91I_02185 [alpha proteobacterium U9-1i]